VPLDPGMTAPDAISNTLRAYPPAQLLDIVSQMKTLAATDPQKATQLLQQAPQLGYAIFQALLLLGLVNTEIIGQLIQQQTAHPPPQVQQPPQPPQQQMPQPAFPPPQPFAQPPANPYAQQPPQFNPYQPQPQYAPTPPAPQPAYQPPPQHAPAPPQPGGDQQAQLIQQVLAMSRDDIMRLDEVPRNQILQLRQQLGAPVS
jgi:cleavage stimulation factor subunit 2